MAKIAKQDFEFSPAADDAAPVATQYSQPFIINNDSNRSGLTSRSEDYCADSVQFPNNQYRLNVEGSTGELNQIYIDLDGSTITAYCLDKYGRSPNGQIFRSAPMAQMLAGLPLNIQYAIAWVIANTYPAVSGAATFALAGVDFTGMDDNDAYAAVQIAIWRLRGELNMVEATLLNCSGGGVSPKSLPINQVVNALMTMGMQFGDIAAAAETAPTQTQQYCPPCGTSSSIQCCNGTALPTNPAVPYITLENCPYDIRSKCGRLLVGPFVMQSNVEGTATISASLLYGCSDFFDVIFTDFCGTAITTPAVGQEFYLSIRTRMTSFCIRLTASMSTTVTEVDFLEYLSGELPPGTTPLQNIAAPVEAVPYNVNFSIDVCIQSCGWSKSCGTGWLGGVNINVNNNDNKNNNNSNSMPWFGCWPQWPQPQPPYPPRPTPPWPCPPGTRWVPGQGCVPIVPPGPNPPGPTPPWPCPSGTQWVPGQGCVPIVPPGPNPPWPCPPGTQWVPGQGCVPIVPPGPNPPWPCPPGTCWMPGQGCVPIIPPGPNPPQPCPPGTCWMPGQGCVPIVPPGPNPPQPCPPGTCWMPEQGCCVPIMPPCSPGTCWTPEENCVSLWPFQPCMTQDSFAPSLCYSNEIPAMGAPNAATPGECNNPWCPNLGI